MRILISVGCTAALLPAFSSSSALANSTDELAQKLSVSLDGPLILVDAEMGEQGRVLPFTNVTPSELEQFEISNSTLAQTGDSWSQEDTVDPNEVENIRLQLQDISNRNFTPSRGAPSLTIANPYGFGADRGFYTGLSYQVDTRYGSEDENDDDATASFGVGFGSATKSIGAELSYSLLSFGTNDRDFGSGGFNLKLHRQIAEGWGVAAGWNSFLSIGDANDLEDSIYLATTKIFKTRKELNSPFSRIAVTVGGGNGQFRTEDALENDDEGFNIFGSLALRVARPVSFVTEWTGQDLAMGLSVSPFRTVPVTINLGVRDITGAGDGARFVVGVGTGF